MDTRTGGTGGLSESDALLAFSRSTVAMVLTDPRLPDNPIVYVNQAFERMTGYTHDMAVGRNCRFLQGEETNRADIAALKRAVAAGEEVSIDLLNYRASGEKFMNRLIITPIQDETGETAYFLGIQKDLSRNDAERPTPAADRSIMEIQHRVKNHLSMIVGLIRMQARETPQSAQSDTLARRIESLQLLYEEMSRPELGGGSVIELGAYLGRICSAVSHLDGRAGIRVNVDMDSIHVDTETALRLGLILSEILTNALQHAFPDRGEGLVRVRVERLTQSSIRMTVADDGIGLPQDKTWPDASSMGGRIALGLIDGIEGELNVVRPGSATIVVLDVPDAEAKD